MQADPVAEKLTFRPLTYLLMVAIKCRPQAVHVVPVIMHPHITSEWPANQLVAA